MLKKLIEAIRILLEPVALDDEDIVVDYKDGRMMSQRPVSPIIMRPFGMKWWPK